MAVQQHKIGRQILELILPQEPGVKSAQDAFLESYYANMLPILERVLDEMVGPDQFLALDNLELDLGKVGLDFEAKELTFKLETVLRESLTEAIEDQRVQEGSLADPNEAQGSESEVLFYFLETGRIPTWLEGSKFVPAALLAKLLSAPPAGFIAEFTRVLSIRAVQRRLAWGFSFELKRQVLEALLPSLTAAIETQIADLQKLHAAKALLPISVSVFELHIWESVLGVIPSVAQSNISNQQVFLRVLERLLPSSVFSGPAATWLLGESLALHGESNVSEPVASAIQYLLERHASELEKPIWRQEKQAIAGSDVFIENGEKEGKPITPSADSKKENEVVTSDPDESLSKETKQAPEFADLTNAENDPQGIKNPTSEPQKESSADVEADSLEEKAKANDPVVIDNLEQSHVEDLSSSISLVNPEEFDENVSEQVLDKKSKLSSEAAVTPDVELVEGERMNNPASKAQFTDSEGQEKLSQEVESGLESRSQEKEKQSHEAESGLESHSEVGGGLESQSEDVHQKQKDDSKLENIDSKKTIQKDELGLVAETDSARKDSLQREGEQKDFGPEEELDEDVTTALVDEIDAVSDEFRLEGEALIKGVSDDANEASRLHKKRISEGPSEKKIENEKTTSESSKGAEGGPQDNLSAREGEKEKLASIAPLSPELEKENTPDDRKEALRDKEGEIEKKGPASAEELSEKLIEKAQTEHLGGREEKLESSPKEVAQIPAKDETSSKKLASNLPVENALEETTEEVFEKSAGDASAENRESIDHEKHSPEGADSIDTPDSPSPNELRLDPMKARFQQFKEMWANNPEALIPQSNSEALHIPWGEPIESGYEVPYAGLILLWPFIPHLFRALGWMEKSEFVDEEGQFKAVIMLHFLATGSLEPPEEQELSVCKLLAGLRADDPVPVLIGLNAHQRKEGEGLLEAVIANWATLKKTSPNGLRKTFLNRSGFLRRDDQGWRLKIERETMDVLIDRIPWGISTIRLSWQPKMIFVEW